MYISTIRIMIRVYISIIRWKRKGVATYTIKENTVKEFLRSRKITKRQRTKIPTSKLESISSLTLKNLNIAG